MARQRLKIIPLGGVGEIGKNMTALEYRNDIIVIDTGLMFPEEEMLGIDLVIPDISYLLEKRAKVRGIIITHGHEDHIGALPYVLPRLNVPVYCTKLAHGLISVKLKEHKLLKEAKLKIIQAGTEFTLGRFRIEPFHVSHSIPDSVGLIIHTPIGVVVHSGDFKLDHTPVDGKTMDLARLGQLGTREVLALLSDSTYAELPGYTPSEKLVGETIDHIIADAPGRVIITTFASLISRMQQVIDAAVKHNRRVFVTGRSMVNNLRMASELGYLNIPPGTIRPINELRNLPHEQAVILTTGSQGEPTSALVRIANRDHPNIRIIPGDTVIISATAIPGNESLVGKIIDSLFIQGAEVLYDKIAPVHVHGHGSQEELKLILNLVKPKFFIPIHGEHRHLYLHAKLARSLGIPDDNIFVLQDGDVLELSPEGGRVTGKIASGDTYVDGLGVGDVGSIILRDRKTLSRDGVMVVIITVDRKTGKIVGYPDLISRGFVDATESEELMEESREVVMKSLAGGGHPLEWNFINTNVKSTLSKFLYKETKRRPMILPIAVDV